VDLTADACGVEERVGLEEEDWGPRPTDPDDKDEERGTADIEEALL